MSVSEHVLREGDLLSAADEIIRRRGSVVAGSSALDKQVAGDHYKKLGEYQPMAVMHKWMTPEQFAGYAKGTAVAYLARQKLSEREDMAKAAHTIQIYLELTEGEQQ